MIVELIKGDSSTASAGARGRLDVAFYNVETGARSAICVKDGIPLVDLQEQIAEILRISLEELIRDYAIMARDSQIGINMFCGRPWPEDEPVQPEALPPSALE